MRRIVLCAVLIVLAIPTICLAARPYRGALMPRPYLGVFGGISIPNNTSISGTDFAVRTDFSGRAEFDPNINIGGTAGLDFDPVRLEGELSYKHAEFSSVSEPPERYFDLDGRVGALALLFNAFLDLHNASAVTPYFGGGIGFASLHLSDTFGTRVSDRASVILYGSDDDTVFAYQAGAGVGIALFPGLTLDVGYRYFATSEATFDSGDIASEFKMRSHNASVGIRVTF